MYYLYIDLDRKSSREDSAGKYKVESLKEKYNANFQKVTYDITYYQDPYHWLNRSHYYFYIREKRGKDITFSYYVNTKKHIVRKIEAYFSDLHPENPLIIGFKSDDGTKYYTYAQLLNLKWSTGLPNTHGFLAKDLQTKLKDENTKRNKLKFKIPINLREHYSENDKSIDEFTKYNYSSGDVYKYENHYVSTYNIFKKEQLLDSSYICSLLNDMKEKFYDFVNTYYTNKNTNTLLLIEFIDQSTKTHFVRKDEIGIYWSRENLKCCSDEDFKAELTKIKSSLCSFTFMLEKTSYDVKFKNKIGVTNQPNESLGFTKYIHTPSNTGTAIVLYNYALFNFIPNCQISRNKLESVQNKAYSKIETYSLNTKLNFHLIVKFTVTGGNEEYYFQRFNEEGTQWKEINGKEYLSTDQNIKDKLIETNYRFKKSILIIINEKNRYNSGITKNSSVSFSTSNPFTIIPQIYGSCDPFTCYKHDFSRYNSKNNDEIVGLRLKCNNNEVNLYNKEVKDENIQYIYYDKTQTAVYVYFYNQDIRPLMLCYNKKVYRPNSKDNFDKLKFLILDDINNCTFQKTDATFIAKLNEINNQLNEVDIFKKREYVVHNYNNKEIKINVKTSKVGCYIRYTHTPSSHNGLGTIKYNDEYIKDSNGSSYIKASGKKEVIVYYNSKDISLKIPLFIALCTRANCTNTDLYYELQDVNHGQNKLYKKFIKSISLETNSNTTLHTTLDRLFYSFTKSISIVLDKRPTNYRSTMTSNSKPDQESTTSITVEQANYPQLNHFGYKCCKHNITSVTNISEVGSLKFYLWDQENGYIRNKELNLYSDSSGSQKMGNIIYTSCKGNVLVFFYDSDPRPLLLCFDSTWYRPKDKANYTDRWVRITKLETCKCTEKGFTQASNLLAELNNIYMELNPVDLGETKKAYKGSGQIDSHSYTIHDYTPQPIKVKITSKELVCYKKYAHEPDNGSNTSYRLGKITYDGLTNYGLSYPEERPLQKVSLYYSVYDTQHKYPLLVKLCFKGGSSPDYEYHKLDDKRTLKWEKLSSDKHKYLLEKLSNKETFESGLYDIRTRISISYTEDEKKKHLFNPEQCKEDKISIAAIAGGTVGTAAVVGTGVTVGVLISKKIIVLGAFTAAVA